MATIRVREGRLYIDYHDEAGKRHRKALHLRNNRDNKKKAEAEKKKIEYELEAGVHVERIKRNNIQTINLSEGLIEFLELKSDKKETTKNCYQLAVNKFIQHMGDLKIYRIDSQTVSTFASRIEFEITKFNRQISKNSIATYNNQLKVIFKFFKERGYVKENPFQHKEIRIKEIVTIPDSEVKDILDKLRAKNIDHYKVITFLLLTGLRVSEIINLTFSHIDLKENIIHVRNEKEDREDKIPHSCFIKRIHT